MDGYVGYISVDVNAENNYQFIKAKQGDQICRTLAISLLRDGIPFAPTGVSTYSFRAAKPDGNAVILESSGSSEPIIVNNGVCTVTLSEQCLAVAGRVVCDLAMEDSEGDILSSATFVMDVIPMPDLGSVIDSSTEWIRLQQAIDDAEVFATILAFRTVDGYIQYTVDGSTWTDLCPLSDVITSITTGQIDTLFD